MDKILERLIQFIRDSRVIQLQYKGFDYLFEPYLIYRRKTDTVYVHGWKISGGGLRSTDAHWCNLIVDEIVWAKPVGQFVAPLEGYNPRSQMFSEIIFQWDRRND